MCQCVVVKCKGMFVSVVMCVCVLCVGGGGWLWAEQGSGIG